MNQTESIRGMATLLAVHRELIRALLAIDSSDAGPLIDLVGLTGAALEDAARYLGTAEVRRIVAGAQRGAAPHIAEIKADPPVKVASLKAERDALAARVAALEAQVAIGNPLDMISWLGGMRHYLRNISAHPSVKRELESLSSAAWDAIVAEVRTRIEEPAP